MKKLCYTLSAILGTIAGSLYYASPAESDLDDRVALLESNNQLEDQYDYSMDVYGSIADAAFDHYHSSGWFTPVEGYVTGEAFRFPKDDNEGFVAYRTVGEDVLHRIELPEAEFAELRPILDELKHLRHQMANRDAAIDGTLPTLSDAAAAMGHCPCEVAQQVVSSCVGCSVTYVELYSFEGSCYHPQCVIWEFPCAGGVRVTSSAHSTPAVHDWLASCGYADTNNYNCWGKFCSGTYSLDIFCGNCIDE